MYKYLLNEKHGLTNWLAIATAAESPPDRFLYLFNGFCRLVSGSHYVILCCFPLVRR